MTKEEMLEKQIEELKNQMVDLKTYMVCNAKEIVELKKEKKVPVETAEEYFRKKAGGRVSASFKGEDNLELTIDLKFQDVDDDDVCIYRMSIHVRKKQKDVVYLETGDFTDEVVVLKRRLYDMLKTTKYYFAEEYLSVDAMVVEGLVSDALDKFEVTGEE